MDVVMISLVASSLVDLGFGPQKDQTKNFFLILICRFSTEH